MVEMNHLNDVAKDDIKSELSRHPSNQETSAESVTLPADTGKDIVLDFMDRLDPSIKEAPISMQEARRVLRKVDLVVLPIMCATTILGAVDKNAIGNTAIMGIMEDANLRGREFSLLGSLFFIGYLVLEWPMSYLIQRLPVAKLLAVTVFFWGVLAMSLAAAHNFAGLAVVRFLSECSPIPFLLSAQGLICGQQWAG